MSHAEQLIEIATELATDVKGEVATLQRRLAELENGKLEMEARLDAAKFALQRLSSFVSVRGNDLQCPRCWILNEAPESPAHRRRNEGSSVCESEFGLRT